MSNLLNAPSSTSEASVANPSRGSLLRLMVLSLLGVLLFGNFETTVIAQEEKQQEKTEEPQAVPDSRKKGEEEQSAPAKPLNIPADIKAKFPELLELILNSESMNDEERQYWINILPIMTPEQIQNLRDILLNEKKQLKAIDEKYHPEYKTWQEAEKLTDEQEYDKAIQLLTESIERDDKMARPYDLRAFAYYKQGKYELAIADYTRAIERAPGLAVYLQWRGICYTRQQAYHLALADYRKATEIEPGSPRYWNSVAWLLATCPQDSLCNGKEAVKAATKACELNGWKSGFYMDTLAAAYAEDGQFDKAVEWQEKALADPELSKSVDEQEMENARLRLELYKAEKPFREHR